jgi:hypothetical protein
MTLIAKLRYAILLSVAAAITSIVIVYTIPGPWKTLCQSGFHTSQTGLHGRWEACVPTYWFHIAAFLGVLTASLTVVRSIASVKISKLILFVLIADAVSMWIGGAVVIMTWRGYPGADNVLASRQAPFDYWFQFPLTTLLLGITFGNLATKGFGVLVALPPLAWLAWKRRRTANAGTVTVT